MSDKSIRLHPSVHATNTFSLYVLEEVERRVAAEGYAIVATDGGSMGGSFRYRVASFGVAVGTARARGRVGGLDQTAYKAEVWALFKLMRTIAGVEGKNVEGGVQEAQATVRLVSLCARRPGCLEAYRVKNTP